MNAREQMTEQVVERVMTEGRQVLYTPDVVRTRLLARARAHVQATSGAVLVPTPVQWASPWGGRRLAFAAAALLAFSTAGAAAALYVRGSRSPEAAPAPEPAPAPHVAQTAIAAAPAPIAEPAAVATPERARHPLSPQESYAAELSLLQRAHAQYNAHAFRGALALLAEHARQFPGGRLAEEREALRVRSLEAAGREVEARRALAAFGKRFPRSALLPRLREPNAAEPARDP